MCTAKSSGWHYNVQCCEGCKGFFRSVNTDVSVNIDPLLQAVHQREYQVQMQVGGCLHSRPGQQEEVSGLQVRILMMMTMMMMIMMQDEEMHGYRDEPGVCTEGEKKWWR